MSKFRVKLKLTGLEIEVEGDREYAPQIAERVGRQLSQVIQPLALIEAPKDAQQPIIETEPQINGGRTPRRRRQGLRTAATSSSADVPAVTWTHNADTWGTPRQEWKALQKIAWMLYVIAEANGQRPELTSNQIAIAFNGKFRSAGIIHQGNVTRDLKREPELFREVEGKWFLKDKGRQTAAEKLVPEALGHAAAATA